MIVRCSSLDRVLECAGSLVDTLTPYNPRSPEAREGSACHEAQRALVRGEIPDVDAIGAKWGVHPDAISKVVVRSQEAWHEVSQYFGGERFADDLTMSAHLSALVTLRGTPDLLAVDRALARLSVLDWKDGWAPAVHPNQLRGYAFLAREKYGMPACGYVLGIEIHVRVGVIRVHKFNDESLDALQGEVLRQVENVGRQWGPSADACKYCPLRNNCQARDQWVQSAVTALAPVGDNLPVTREQIGAIYGRTRALASALRQYDQVVRAMPADGPIPLPDGTRLELVEETEDRLVPSKAMRHLREDLKLTSDELDAAVRITKGGLEKVIKARAGKGKGAAAWRVEMKQLDELGAIEKVTTPTVQIVGEQEKSQ